jgi:hypothetical protein
MTLEKPEVLSFLMDSSTWKNIVNMQRDGLKSLFSITPALLREVLINSLSSLN